MTSKYQPSEIQLESVLDEKKDRLFKSVNKILSLRNPQFYNPYFELVTASTCSETHNTTQCLPSKYKILEVDFIIDSDNEYEVIDGEESGDECQENTIDSGDMYTEKLQMAEEEIETLPTETKELITEVWRQDHLECKMRTMDDDDKIINCIPIMAKIERLDTKTNTSKTYRQKLFCKRSPLLEPLKIILNEQSKITPQTDITNMAEDLLQVTAKKINSIHNSSHVEAFGLYCLSKLTEANVCPTFPYYFGCLNGISSVYYHNITEEMPELYKKKWFIDKSHSGEFEIIYVTLNSELGSKHQSNSSIDLDDLLARTLESKELNDVSSISSMDDEELTKLTDILQTRFDELTTLDANENIKNMVDTKQDFPLQQEPKIQNTLPSAAKIIYPETDEYNFDGFDIDVQQGGAQDTINNSTIDTELEELDMDSIINMREFLQNKVFFAKFKDMPVNYCFMERLGKTLDDVLNETGGISEDEWLSMLFQVTFGLAVANKYYSFVHNDLHSDNILFQTTKETHIYYAIKNIIKGKDVKEHDSKAKDAKAKEAKYKFFRIPTFGKVSKIIDFARATFKYNNKWIFSDVFMPSGEAAGQYKFPDCPESEYWGSDFIGADEPNPSFDLARLARSIKHQVNIKSVYALIKKWSKSDDGTNMLDKEDDFDLYIDIAKNCHNAVPKHVLQDKIFKKFEVCRSVIPKGKHIYIL